ncbi:alkanesulfonate monooxygenase SsuD/methylene tetrahydromethanopterin reductase-like flavin-dependent oxidoreductase (luciferase family) [Peribacillus huizhouensis]|uniref:Alkanesulfonate monooxygenase SsuD/methylene tetrahydromethanopterin reductase-like flavin-dependent oxidoreductase (Luciferase family) n=1 Tax=Peribacillus huizhouensis TaxID=1501239 RepID=A0ABR6CUV6_9BACI|nr:LLM class flavin-dependent oxidoreductase [Peribacillus huizhouensis]MBA9028706.1 alkanesulfonate monooxygenase SsuD/methylene tetrahydromethanopterin reductase-like flavin-dependent oxidoreductase (luciferase family) [Peribacillus huizhouensis]
MSTLDHLTNGRIGWNIVTPYLESGTKKSEIGDKFQHGKRYNIAEEYLEVYYKLWEGSWEKDAVVKDKENRVYTDPTKVHDINHHGKYFDEEKAVHVGQPHRFCHCPCYESSHHHDSKDLAMFLNHFFRNG